MKPTAGIAVFLLLISARLPAQDAAEAGPPRLLLCVENRMDPPCSAAEILTASKSMAFALKAAADRLIIVEYGGKSFPETSEGRAGACRETRTDGWLWVGISGSSTAPTLLASSYDASVGVSVLDGSFPLAHGMSLAELAREQWQDIVPAVAAYFGPRVSSGWLPRDSTMGELVLRALPGTRITGLPGDPLTVPESGAAEARVPTQAVYTIRAELSGYRPSSMDVYIVAGRDISFVQEPGPRWAFDASFYNSLYPGADAAFFIVPGWIFTRITATTYLLGLALNHEDMFYSAPLFTFALGFGSYLLPEDFPIRAYASAGAFLRLSWPEGTGPGLDALSPWGISADLGMELPVTDRGGLFFEYAPLLYMTENPILIPLFMASLGAMESQVGYIPVSFGIVSLLNFRFGFRWLL